MMRTIYMVPDGGTFSLTFPPSSSSLLASFTPFQPRPRPCGSGVMMRSFTLGFTRACLLLLQPFRWIYLQQSRACFFDIFNRAPDPLDGRCVCSVSQRDIHQSVTLYNCRSVCALSRWRGRGIGSRPTPRGGVFFFLLRHSLVIPSSGKPLLPTLLRLRWRHAMIASCSISLLSSGPYRTCGASEESASDG